MKTIRFLAAAWGMAWLLPFILAASLFPAGAVQAGSSARPNIVFILADDLGYTDVGCFGSKYYETPNIDRMATQGMTDTKRPEHYALDGTSYLDLLTNGGRPDRPRPPVFQHFPGYLGAGGGTWRTAPGGAIRDGDWKLLKFFEDGRLELYNLKDDVGEKHDLAAARPDKVKELHAQLLAWQKAAGAPMPTKNPKIEKPGNKNGRKKQRQSVEDESE